MRPVGPPDYLFLALCTGWMFAIIWSTVKFSLVQLRWYEQLALALWTTVCLGACCVCWLIAYIRIAYR